MLRVFNKVIDIYLNLQTRDVQVNFDMNYVILIIGNYFISYYAVIKSLLNQGLHLRSLKLCIILKK